MRNEPPLSDPDSPARPSSSAPSEQSEVSDAGVEPGSEGGEEVSHSAGNTELATRNNDSSRDLDSASEALVGASTPELDALIKDPVTRCLNCGQSLPGAYCPSCGQKAQVLRQPVHHFLRDAIVEFFGLDGRVWRTFGALLFKPGTLTLEYQAGRRQTYLRPLRVYLTATLLFFFLLSLIDPVGRAKDSILLASDTVDSVRVADQLAETDTILARGFESLEDERRQVQDARRHVDSLSVLVSSTPDLENELEEARIELEEAQDELAEDSLKHRNHLQQERVERAILATMPPDSIIQTESVRSAAQLVYPDTTSFITGNGGAWLMRSEALRGLTGSVTQTQRRDNLVRFLRSAIGQVPTVLFLILPLFALLLKLLYVRRSWYYSEHLIFGLHTHAYTFTVFSLFTIGVLVLTRLDEGGLRSAVGWILTGLLVSIPLYFFIAQKRVYGQGWAKTAVKAIVMANLYGFILFVGLVAVLVITALLG